MKAAYLGPEDSYSHQATLEIFHDQEIDLLPCTTITNVFETSTPYAVIPISNTIHGVVQESLNNLLGIENTPAASAGSDFQSKWTVVGSHSISVQHNLIVRRGIPLEDVKWVGSHEQALGQCSKYLDQHLPGASRIPFPSTAQAATLLAGRAVPESYPSSTKLPPPSRSTLAESDAGAVAMNADDDRLEGEGAAICSTAVIERLGQAVEVIGKSIQNVSENYTRFLLLRQTNSPEVGSPPSGKTTFLQVSSPSALHALPEENRVLDIHKPKSMATEPAGVEPPGIVSRKKFGSQALSSSSTERYLVEVQGLVGAHPENAWMVLGST